MEVFGPVVAGAVTLLLGVLSLTQAKASGNNTNFYFFVLSFSAAVWAMLIALFLATDNPEVATIIAAGYYAAAALIALAVMLVGFSIADRKWQPSVLFGAIAVTPFIVVVTALMTHPELLIVGVDVGRDAANIAHLNPTMYLFYVLYFVTYFLTGMFALLRGYHNSTGRMRKKNGFVLFACLFGGSIGMTFDLFLPLFGNYSYIWIGPLGLLAFVSVIYFTITRYGLFDIKQTITRGLVYTLTLATLASIYILLAHSVTSWLGRLHVLPEHDVDADSVNLLHIILTLGLVFLFQPIKRLFDKITNEIFYRHRYSKEEFYAHISNTLASTNSLRHMLLSVSNTVAQTLQSEQVVFIVHSDKKHVSVGTKDYVRIPRADVVWLDEQFYSAKNITTPLIHDALCADFDTKEMARFMVSHRASIILPLPKQDAIIGYLILGRHKGGTYSQRDVRTLETISDELTIAIQNALSIQEVKELNETLQQKIDEATRELRHSNAQLRRLDETKDEFISMASHQLRTPLTSIKGYLDMILEGDAGEINESQRKFLTEAFASSDRMVHLINDFLNVSRLQTGKFAIEKRPNDIEKIVKQEVDSLKLSAEQRKLKFKLSIAGDVPKLMLDEAKIRQVIMNFADNAIYYSKPDTEILVSVALDGNRAEVMVKDTGIGVPKDEQGRLFGKFFRATNARNQRPDGTGVGLYLAKRVILGHGGDVIFSSEEGKGSTFGFWLPISKLEVKD